MRIIISRPKNDGLLLEGRKENATAMIVKKINDPRLRQYLLDPILNNLIVADPSSNKKYIEWAARRMSEVARIEEDDRYILAMNQAGQDPDGFLPGGPGDKEYTPGRLKMIQGYTDEQRSQGGYLSNNERYLRHLEDSKVNIENRANVIVRSLRKYHRLAERNLMNKNIDTYKEIYEWEHDVYKAEKDEQEREEMKKREKGAKESTDYLHDDNDYMIVRPRSEDGSCYYGRGTKWCISATQSRNYFAQYTGEGTGFYFVLFKHLPQGDSFKKLALVFTAGSDEPSEVFDVTDDEVSTEAITEAALHNVLAKGLKEALAKNLKQLKGPARQAAFKQSFENLIELYEMFVDSEEIEDMEEFKLVLLKIGLDEEDLKNDNADLILEYIRELATEQEYDILGQASSHFEENPAGPTDADFDALHEQHKYDYVYVSYDMYDESRYYWDAGFSLDFTDIHEDLENADADEVEQVIRKILDDYHTYPDEFDGYGTEISVRFSPDYDENEGLNGFENFLNRMDDVDQALHKMMDSEKEDTLVAFQEAGLIAGVTMKSLKQRFDDLELDNFEIDIEEKELSIYKRLNITVPIPAHLYQGLTAGAAEWTTGHRADISKSPALGAFDAMIRQRTSEHSEELIKQIVSVFDKVFELYKQKVETRLPGFEIEPIKGNKQQQFGLLVPEYNVGIYRTSDKTQVGPSGLMLGYFFDVRIEADEEDSKDEGVLKVIELFLKNIDREKMLEKIQVRLETIVQNDVIKNIIPEFEEGGDSPEIDARTGKVLSRSERESKESKEAAVDELSTMFESAPRLTPFEARFTKERKLISLLSTLKDFTMSRSPGSEAVIAQINRLLQGSTKRDHQNILKTINASFEYAVTAPKNGRALNYLNRMIKITQGNMEGIMAHQGRMMIDKYKPGLDAGDKASRQFQKDLPDKINKMHREAEDLIKATKNAPKKPGVFKKLISRLPGIGRIFIAGGVLLAADKAFAAEGLPGVAKVLADNAVNLTPIVGDIKGIIDILGSAGVSAGAEMRRVTGGDVQMFEHKKKLKIKILRENTQFGGLYPGLAGQMGANLGTTAPLNGIDNQAAHGADTKISAKVVLHRNGKVLLIKNEKGWDLPGGHIKQDENILSGLMREVFEETGLTLSSGDIKSMNVSHKHKRFFCGQFTTDDVRLGEEHYEYGFFTLEEILNMDDVMSIFKKVINKCLNGDLVATELSDIVPTEIGL